MMNETDSYLDSLTPMERALDFYSDVYKSVYGFRPRHEWHGTLEELNAEIEDLCTESEEQVKLETAFEEDAWRQFLKRVEEYSTQFNIGKADAIRWIFQADEIHLANIDEFCYANRLSYSRETTIKEMLDAR